MAWLERGNETIGFTSRWVEFGLHMADGEWEVVTGFDDPDLREIFEQMTAVEYYRGAFCGIDREGKSLGYES